MWLELSVTALILITAYLLGSIPTGYLAGRWLKGIDIRECGSGSTGATNVLRTLGKVPAVVVLLVDVFKGVAAIGAVAPALKAIEQSSAPKAIALIKDLYALDLMTIPASWQVWLVAGAGFAAVLGHSKSIWLNFTGGKSVATGLGVLFAMSWQVGLGTFGVFAIVLGLSRIVSLSSIAGAIAVGLLMIILKQPLPYQLFAGAAGLYIILRHRSNIERLFAGSEPQIGQTLPQTSESN